MNSDGKWGNGLGNGVGLTINERENGETATFQMHPELFNDSYLPTLLAGAQRVDDYTIEDMRWISFISPRHTLVSLTVITN
jgi:hypothetical protein